MCQQSKTSERACMVGEVKRKCAHHVHKGVDAKPSASSCQAAQDQQRAAHSAQDPCKPAPKHAHAVTF